LAPLRLVLAHAVAAQDVFLSGSQRRLEYHHLNPGFFDPDLVFTDVEATNPRERHHHATRLQRAARETTPRVASSAVVNPVEFGADPTGTVSSSDAMDAAVKAVLDLKKENRKDFLGHYDLGGAVLDLSGGVYLIDRPVSFPALYANFRVTRGTLLASPQFPADQYMLVVGGQGCSETKDGGCNRNVDISHMTLDGQSTAFGGIVVNHTMNINIGPAMYVTSWTGVGISLEGSGAGQIHQAWLGEIPPGSPTPRSDAKGTAILLADGQHDAQVSDVIIFSGKKGVVSVNGANHLQGVHAWNLMGSAGGVGIELGKSGTWAGASGGRVQNSYLDFAPLVVTNPGDCIISNNLFLGSSTMVFRATQKNFAVRNLIVTSNIHHGGQHGNQSITLDETLGSFGSIIDTVIENNEVDVTDAAVGKKSSRATKSVVLGEGSRDTLIYFVDDLVFNSRIDEASVRCWLYGVHSTSVSATLKYDMCVNATLAEPVPAGINVTLTCEVDQSSRACAAH